ncbi:MAG: molybdopterin-binding protein [Christensenella sp.]|nr:molybdopterin-binding protein [Christensenella sp.]
MKLIDTQNAAGHVLCHDLTRIVPGESKDAQFRKGHVVTEEDIPMLLSMGKDHLYVWEVDENTLHENEAAGRLAALCESAHMYRGDVKEGKIELFATEAGVFTVDVGHLNALNDLPDIMVATRHTNSSVHPGDKLGGTRIIPLLIDRRRIEDAEALVGPEPLMRLHPFRKGLKAGIVVTGNEVFHGRITDKFTPVVEKKLSAFGVPITQRRVSDDQTANIIQAIAEVRAAGVDLVLCTGGMSVDPDDRTPAAIRDSGAEIVTYGAPVLPGAMFLLGYYADGVPVMGLPGCVMYSRASIFDIVLPRVIAGMRIFRRDLTRLGNGGLCLQCETCTYPNCGFGKE